MLPGLFGTDPWFEPKKLGYGSGLPCAWQGWVVLLAFLAIIIGAVALVGEDRPLLLIAIVLPVTAIFILIAAKTTRGGWKWRFGKDEDTW